MIDLREHEAEVLRAVAALGGTAKAQEVAARAGVDQSAIMRAALTLVEKGLLSIGDESVSLASLTDEGRAYAKVGLPERRVLEATIDQGGRIDASRVTELANVPQDMLPVLYGWLRKKRWASLEKSDGNTVIVAESVVPPSTDERLLQKIARFGEFRTSDLSAAELGELYVLKRRKLLAVHEHVEKTISITEEGSRLASQGITVQPEVSSLTPEMLATGAWRNVRLRRYNVRAPVAATWPGRKQPYKRFLDELKWKLVALGFKEMTGPIVETMFFNCDALYMPQDHPAREVHDIYLVKDPQYGDDSSFSDYLSNVKETHKDGWKTGSTGWRSSYSESEASRLVLRSHGTAESARTLISKSLEIPGKYFSIARCYRPDKVDRTHLTEFNQVEGIVLGEDLTLRDLLGVLERFAVDIAGADEVRFNPDYFPFTEPSVELVGYKEGAGWFEFGGSGIFRPELTRPLGVTVPVIAWGLGVERLFMMKAGIDDVRALFSQDLDWMRRQELV